MLTKEELVILELLRAKGTSGPSSLVRISEGRLKSATIYGALSRLVEGGLIKKHGEDSADSVARTLPVYEITTDGIRAYEQEKRSA